TVTTRPDPANYTKPVQQGSKPWLWVAFGGAGILVLGLIALVTLFFVLRPNKDRQANNVEPSNPAPAPSGPSNPAPTHSEPSKPSYKPSEPSVPVPHKVAPYEPGNTQPNSVPVDQASRAEAVVVRGESLSRSDIEGLDKSELERLRNAVYARHGR